MQISGFHSGVAIGRAELLRILLDRAQQVGVEVELGAAPPPDDLAAEADLVIAADGVSSGVRTRYAADFGAQVEVGRGWFIWCGSTAPLSGTVFTSVRTEHGVFVVHAYPYAADRSTYVFEAGGETLARAGFADRAWGADGDSDADALAYLSSACRSLLGGGQLIGNRSRWTQFRTVTCGSWHRGNVVLLGDAAATAHPSIGSGTKLALESAIALAGTLDRAGASAVAGDAGFSGLLARFEQSRRPAVSRLQALARRSHLWWESFPIRQDLAPARVAAAYLSRAGAVSLADLRTTAPQLASRAVAEAAGGSAKPGEPAGASAELSIGFDDPWGADADAAIRRAHALRAAGARIIRLTGGPRPADLRDRLAFGERLRAELSALVEVVAAASQLDEVADGLVAGRTDLVRISPAGPVPAVPAESAAVLR